LFITLLRHSYISHMLAYGQLSIRDREQLAAEMCHSPATQAQYQWIEPRQTGTASSVEKLVFADGGAVKFEA
jgi:hypothetical protein